MTSRPTLLFLVTEDWFVASHWLPMARAVRDQGWRVVVATRVSDHGSTLEAEGFEVIPLGWRRGKATLLSLLTDVVRVWRVYRRVTPDIVHHISLKPVLVGGIAARLAGPRRVVNAITGFGFIIGAGSDGTATRTRLLRVLPWVTKRPGSVLLFENDDDRLLALSEGLTTAPQTAVIRGAGVNVAHFQPLLEPNGDGITLGFCGRMLAQKGVGDLVEALRLARSENPNLKLLLAGKPDPDNPASLTEQQLLEWDSEDGITWLGHLSDVRDLWRQADIACIPSRGGEGVPKALLEAAACGRPAIVSDVPGCRDVVTDGKSGFVIPARNPERLAQAILTLAGDAELRRRCAVSIRETVEGDFAETAIVAQTLELYESMLTR